MTTEPTGVDAINATIKRLKSEGKEVEVYMRGAGGKYPRGLGIEGFDGWDHGKDWAIDDYRKNSPNAHIIEAKITHKVHEPLPAWRPTVDAAIEEHKRTKKRIGVKAWSVEEQSEIDQYVRSKGMYPAFGVCAWRPENHFRFTPGGAYHAVYDTRTGERTQLTPEPTTLPITVQEGINEFRMDDGSAWVRKEEG